MEEHNTMQEEKQLLKSQTTTDWEQIEKRAKKSETALAYMREHPLTHEQAVEQTLRLKEKLKNN